MALRRFTVGKDVPLLPRLDRFLAAALPGVSLAKAQALIHEGRVLVGGKRPKPMRRLYGGEEVEVDLPTPRAAPRVEGPAVPVLYEDAEVLVVDKPPGLTVEPEGRAPSVVSLVAGQVRGLDVGGVAAPGVVHRLDRETSGCLALARRDGGVHALKAAFLEKRVDKRYLTLVLGAPPDAERLEAPYGRDPLDPRRFTTRRASPRRAALSFTVRERLAGAALLEVRLETGRTHQIRVQLSEAGFPVLGDPVYGGAAAAEHPAARAMGRLALHAVSLTLEGVGAEGRIAVEAPPPGDFARALALLRR
jgi:23S rRNA pseudouridine1911/1915/1917 synthase